MKHFFSLVFLFMIPKDYQKGLFLLMAFVTLEMAKLLLVMSVNKLE